MNIIYVALNKHNRTVSILPFSTWAECQQAFRFGIQMPDGSPATGIGSISIERMLREYATIHGWRVI